MSGECDGYIPYGGTSYNVPQGEAMRSGSSRHHMTNNDIVKRLQDYQRDPEMSDDDLGICNEAADLLDAIDAQVNKWDGYNGDDVTVAIKMLLHPEGGPS